MPIHEEVLKTARRLCAAKRTRTFTAAEVVAALPHLNEDSVRTHVISRCCVNAPPNHNHRWPYFERLERGKYAICKTYRDEAVDSSIPTVARPAADAASTGDPSTPALRGVIHAVIAESKGLYVAECLEVAVVTQVASLDETLGNLREVLDLYMSDEEPATLGLVQEPRLIVSIETYARAA